MAGARETIATVLLSLFGAILLSGCQESDMSNVPPEGRVRAEALVAAYSQKRGVPDRLLTDENYVTYGEVSLRYLPESDELAVRVYVNAALLENAPPEELENYHKIVTFLNDPEVGGMYERAGGYFVLDDELQAYLLVRDTPVAQLTPPILVEQIEGLEQAAASWTTGWLGEVAMVMHGHRSKPTERVTIPEQ